MPLQRAKRFFNNFQNFPFFTHNNAFFLITILLLLSQKKTVFWTLLGEFFELWVETLGLDASTDDFKRGKNIFLKIFVFSVSFSQKTLF